MKHVWISRAPLILRLLGAASAGAIGAFAQAPYDITPAIILSLALGFAIWRVQPGIHGLMGWAFGSGYFVVALFWILEPFQVDAARHGWMAPFALVFLSAGLALFWAAAFWLAGKIAGTSLSLVFAWTGAEIARAYLFTGFPWASPAQVTVDGPASVLLSLGGPHVTTLCLMLCAWILSLPTPPGRTMTTVNLGKCALILSAVLALTLPNRAAPPEPTGNVVRLVQPNAAQHLKWRWDKAEEFLQRQLDFSAAAPSPETGPPDLIVWPETAIPWLLGDAGDALPRIADAANGVPLVLGLLRFEGADFLNALVVLDETGAIASIYDKHHLVPFGEYVPLEALVEKTGFQALAASMGGFAPGPGPVVLDLGSAGKAMPLICYEAVFAHGVNAMPERANFLLQITNDAWFGTFAGPQQHLAQARMRAIEQGLPMLRAANTGISAVIAPDGRVMASLALGQSGYLDADVPAPFPPTVYSRLGDWPALLVVLAGLVVLGSGAARRQRK